MTAEEGGGRSSTLTVWLPSLQSTDLDQKPTERRSVFITCSPGMEIKGSSGLYTGLWILPEGGGNFVFFLSFFVN